MVRSRSISRTRSRARWSSPTRGKSGASHGRDLVHRAVRVRARGVRGISGHLPRAAAAPHAADVGHQRDLGHLARRIARARGGGLRHARDVARLYRRHLLEPQRDRRVPDHRPHAAHVQAQRLEAVMLETAIQLAYLAASVLFILGLKGLAHPDTARRGMLLAELGMLMAIVGTLLKHEIVRYEWIIAGIAIGGAIGAGIPIWMPMTPGPPRTAPPRRVGAPSPILRAPATPYRQAGGIPPLQIGGLGFEGMFGLLPPPGG